MNKKVIVGIIIGVVLFWLFCGIGMKRMDDYQDRLADEEFFEDSYEFLLSDASFLEEYGEISSGAFPKGEHVKQIDSGVWHVPCIITLKNGKTYRVVIENNYIAETFSYVSVEEIKEHG
ncbi:MAG: hypothetical protein E7666_06350 [Ruminococcaceae bacterium]|nr:hypothetical protein [Oscillospiraceae bacterium]